MRFEHLGAFAYSPEEGTPAAKLKKRVAPAVAERRRREIMELQRELSLGNNRRLVGRTLRVLVEEPVRLGDAEGEPGGVSAEGGLLLVGRHEGQAPEIDGVVYIDGGSAAAGQFVDVEITEAHEYDLVGNIVL